MSSLEIRPKDRCRWDLVALGEVMLRLDPGDERIATTRQFRVWEGGGEYNVARGLARCFGMDTAIVTALADNPIGRLVEDLMRQGGVALDYVRWLPFDGVGRAVRNGLNFVERGFGLRSPIGCSDRGHTATSQLVAGAMDWDRIFARDGARWFHTGGIFTGLSDSTPAVALGAMEAAHRSGAIVSYDANFRPSLWQSRGGQSRAGDVNRMMLPHVDVLFGHDEDFAALLGRPAAGHDARAGELAATRFEDLARAVRVAFPNVAVVATTVRVPTSASRNDWAGLAYGDGRLHAAGLRSGLEIYDRVGGGDAFAAGLIYGLLSGRDLGWSVECGTAHGALAMTTPGDSSMATLAEVLEVMDRRMVHIAR
jgi:2-dehydro-3-deoxygluconokinase